MGEVIKEDLAGRQRFPQERKWVLRNLTTRELVSIKQTASTKLKTRSKLSLGNTRSEYRRHLSKKPAGPIFHWLALMKRWASIVDHGLDIGLTS